MSRRGALYIVSTPIGNLEDLTFRALRVLKEVSMVAAEDTRRTRKLLTHYGISQKLVSYWGERERAGAEKVMSHIREGRSVALVSDAGTPGISDPGAVLIRKAIEEGVPVVPVPGPSALVTALSVAGLSTEEFTFAGFLSAKKGQRIKKLESLALEPRTVVLYEAPHRVLETLVEMEEIFGPDRRAAVSRELTKMNEETIRGPLAEVVDAMQEKPTAGEYVIAIEGKKQGGGGSFDEALKEVHALMKKGKGRKEASTSVAKQYGISKKKLYDGSLQ